MNFADLRRDHDVGRESERGAGAGRDAVHRADDRHRQRCEAADQGIVTLFNGQAEVGRVAAGRNGAVGKILSRAKAASGAGDQQGAEGFVLFDFGQRFGDLVMHRCGEGVEAVRAIEGQARRAGLDRKSNGLERHRCLIACLAVAKSYN